MALKPIYKKDKDGNVEYVEVEGKKYPVETGEYYDDFATVNILGTEYKIEKKAYKDEPVFEKKRIDGYCDSFQKLIVFCDLDTFDRWDDEPDTTKRECEKEILRHEITRAFLTESGLADSSNPTDGAWAMNEEMVDWFAIQSPKIFKVFQELDIL